MASTGKPEATTYNLLRSNGTHIRKATMVTFPDGKVVRFVESMPKGRAIAQAKRLIDEGIV